MTEDSSETSSSGIGTLNEGSLHVALKDLVAEPGDRFEVPMGRFVIDIVRGDQLIEIQTGAFGAMGRKLDHLLAEHQIHIVHPIATETRFVRGGEIGRRSPKRGSIYNVFDELVRIPTLIDHPHLTLEIVLVTQHKHQVMDPKARRRRGGWRTVDRTLTEVVERVTFGAATDLAALLPKGLPPLWTTADLAAGASVSRSLAQAMAYCLKANELIEPDHRDKAGIHYRTVAR